MSNPDVAKETKMVAKPASTHRMVKMRANHEFLLNGVGGIKTGQEFEVDDETAKSLERSLPIPVQNNGDEKVVAYPKISLATRV
jgi:hypothetical protein